MTEVSEAERMLNLGIDVEGGFGKLTLKELCLEDIVRIAKDVLAIVAKLLPEVEKGGTTWVVSALSDPQLVESFKTVMATSAGVDKDRFNKLSLKDWLKLIKALKTVSDWESIKQLFFDIAGTQTALLGLAAGMQRKPRTEVSKTAASQA